MECWGMKSIIYYFSGTGNSLHVARELQKRIPGSDVLPILDGLDNVEIKADAETVGFVFPVYFLTIPFPYKIFLNKLDLSTVQYIFAVGTRGGTKSEAFSDIDEILMKKGKKLNATLNINMVFNNMLGKDIHVPFDDELKTLEADIQEKLDTFGKIIVSEKDYIIGDKDITYRLPLWKTILFIPFRKFLIKKLFVMYQKMFFYYTTNCTGCGICEKVCLSEKIKMADCHPVWREEIVCYSCFACLNFCPQHSIQIRSGLVYKSYTNVNGRYHYPQITVNDIAGQKGEIRNDKFP